MLLKGHDSECRSDFVFFSPYISLVIKLLYCCVSYVLVDQSAPSRNQCLISFSTALWNN